VAKLARCENRFSRRELRSRTFRPSLRRAGCVRAQQLDRLVFVPRRRHRSNPTRPGPGRGPPRAAAPGDRRDQRFEISDYELRQGGVSYTINSVRHFRQLYPHDRLFWVIGVTNCSRCRSGKASMSWCVRSSSSCSSGRGTREDPPEIAGLRLHGAPVIGSKSAPRAAERARRGLALDYFMPHKTVVFIEKKALYRA